MKESTRSAPHAAAASSLPPLADERTLAVLDFFAIADRLADLCASDLGREAALALRPSARHRAVAADLAETAEARALADVGQRIPLEGLYDVREPLGRAARGGVCGAAELWAIGETAGSLTRLRAFFAAGTAEAERAPRLAEWAEGLADFGPLAAEIGRCLLPDGEVADRASPALAAARAQVRGLEAALRDRLDELVRSAEVQTALREPLITQRQGRFVLPVRSDRRSQVPGVLHDESGSGATVFVEPLAVVELGNRLRAAESAVREEIVRILTDLSTRCGADPAAWRRSLDAAAHLDLCSAKGRLADAWRAVQPQLLDAPALHLEAARHPLIARPVPIDLRVGDDFDVLVLTGPNTGGKTVSLKIAGLFVLMAQAGLHLPASGARLGVFPRVAADVGDDQGVAQSLSTFSSHLRAVVAALGAVMPGALVLLDELGAGTDPGEGAALAMALCSHLLAAGARVIVTSHFGELKAFAYRTPRVENGSVSFDAETLEPTFRLVIGKPGPSQAFAIAERLGLPPEVVERARGLRRPGEGRIEDMLTGMAADERRAREAAEQAEAERRAAAELRREAEEARASLAAGRAEAMAAARQEAAAVLAEARREADATLRELRRLADEARRDSAAEVVEEADAARQSLRAAETRAAARPARPRPAPGRLHAGQPVRILSLDREGVLVGAPGDSGAVVQAGSLRLNVPLEDLAPAAAPTATPARRPERRPAAGVAELLRGAPLECDLRGLDRTEALARVDKALDDAVLAACDEIRLIHGKGTGALRDAVSEFLRGHPQVAGFRLGGAGEGGAGATVVTIRG